MSRLKDLRKYIDKKLNKIEDEDKRTSAITPSDAPSGIFAYIQKRIAEFPDR